MARANGTDDGRGPRWGMVCAGTALIGACYGLARFSYGLFAPQFQAEFAMSTAVTGLVAAGSYVGYSIAIVASMLLTERLGARAVAAAAGAVATVGVTAVALAPSSAVLAAGLLVAGSSTGLASPPMAAAVARWVAAPVRDRAQAIVNAGTGAGVLLSGPVALALSADWRAAWGTFAVLCALTTLWVLRAVPAAAATAGPGPATGPLLPAGSARLLVAALLLGAASSAVWTFGRAVITTVGGAGAGGSAAMWITIGAAGLVGAVSAGVTERLGPARAWTTVLAALATATLLLARLPGSTAVVLIAAAVFGAAYIVASALLLFWSTRLYADHPATGVGASFLMVAVGQAVGAPLVGALVDLTSYGTAFVAAAAIAVVGALVRPRGDDPAPEAQPNSTPCARGREPE